MARGGRRRGTTGQAYGNRTDLNAPKPNMQVYTGQPYGAATQQAQAQAAVPASAPAPIPSAPQGGQGPQGAVPPGLPPGGLPTAPGALGDLHRPTDRPGEPVTHGLPTGPGGGPEVLGQGAQPMDPVTQRIYALYQRFPIQEIADLLS